MPDRKTRDIWLLTDDDQFLRDCTRSFCKRASGHGGQKLNKTSSAVRLSHRPSGLTSDSADFRSQAQNKHDACKKLRWKIVSDIRCPPEPHDAIPDPVPSPRNPLYPAFAAILLDHLAFHHWILPRAAESLNTQRTKLERILRRDPALFRIFAENKSHGEPPPSPE